MLKSAYESRIGENLSRKTEGRSISHKKVDTYAAFTGRHERSPQVKESQRERAQTRDTQLRLIPFKGSEVECECDGDNGYAKFQIRSSTAVHSWARVLESYDFGSSCTCT
jgi:hypothetical protein